MSQVIVRLPEVLSRTGLGRSSIYSRVAARLFTPPVPLGGRAVGWPVREIDAINSARIAGKTDDEIRELVAKLYADRKLAAAA